MAVRLASESEAWPYHWYSRTASGSYVRHVRRTNGTVITTLMGRVTPRRGENAEAAAERALLSSPVRPAVARNGLIRAVDVFAGCGGLSLGAWEAARAVGRRFEAAAAFEFDEDAMSIYRANFTPKNAHDRDIRTIVGGQLWRRLSPAERELRAATGAVDLVLAGPPCQGFSALNHKTRGSDDRNNLYTRVARIAQILEPAHVVIENVDSVGADTHVVVRKTLNELGRMGYWVQEHVVTLSDIGVPQLRRRHVAVASLSRDLDLPELFEDFQTERRTLRWAIGDLRPKRASPFDSAAVASPDNRGRMAYLRTNRLFDLPNSQRPSCHRDKVHSYNSMYGRLRWSAPAQTVTSGYGSMGQGRYVHPNGRRTLTPHEAARLQFFPDWFDFGGRSRTTYANTIGNAVPMKLGYTVVLGLIR